MNNLSTEGITIGYVHFFTLWFDWLKRQRQVRKKVSLESLLYNNYVTMTPLIPWSASFITYTHNKDGGGMLPFTPLTLSFNTNLQEGAFQPLHSMWTSFSNAVFNGFGYFFTYTFNTSIQSHGFSYFFPFITVLICE